MLLLIRHQRLVVVLVCERGTDIVPPPIVLLVFNKSCPPVLSLAFAREACHDKLFDESLLFKQLY